MPPKKHTRKSRLVESSTSATTTITTKKDEEWVLYDQEEDWTLVDKPPLIQSSILSILKDPFVNPFLSLPLETRKLISRALQ